MRHRRGLSAFKPAEFKQRIERARELNMTRGRLDALLLTSEQNLEYLSGFCTQFTWNTPARPWYFLLPPRATSAGIAACVPGNMAERAFNAQADVLIGGGMTLDNVGRFGHGPGKHLTEPPSNKPGDLTRLAPGMVMTIEQSTMFGRGRIPVHGENVLVTEDGPRLLTRRVPRELPVLTL